jgi:hypothetical protein
VLSLDGGCAMATLQSPVPAQAPTHESLLITATEKLIQVHRAELPIGDVIAAVARAKLHVDRGLAVCQLDPPPADEYVVLVVGLARQELAKRVSR